MPKASIRQAELARYLRAMRDAGFDEGRIVIEKPDGTRVSIVAGKAAENAEAGDEIEAMIERLP